jgi:hypothetical protein
MGNLTNRADPARTPVPNGGRGRSVYSLIFDHVSVYDMLKRKDGGV